MTTGTWIDARAERWPFRDKNSWAWLMSVVTCEHCAAEWNVHRPAEATMVRCEACNKYMNLKRERVLKWVK